MGWKTKFSKAQIAKALDNGQQTRVVNNGWIRLDSSISSPTKLGDLKTPGNYITSYWTDGPSLGEDVVSTLNIVVVVLDGDTYQYANIANKKFHRVMIADSELYDDWIMTKIDGSTNPSYTGPIAPVDGETLWLDTSDPNYPTMKVYINGDWKEVVPENVLISNIYDTHNKKLDIFKYIDDIIANTSLEDIADIFNNHITDKDIHTSSDEKTTWNKTPSNSEIDASISEMHTLMEEVTENIINESNDKVYPLTTSANSLKENIINHDNINEIHPTVEQQNAWDNKSDKNHQHYLDGRVSVDVDHIAGNISGDKLPYEVKERVYIVSDLDKMYQIQKNPIHNGDIICVDNEIEVQWYFVIDDTYLGTEFAATKAFKYITSGTLNWENILNKPSTLEGYGITDSATTEMINDLGLYIDDISSKIPNHDYSSAEQIKEFYESSLNQVKELDTQLSDVLEESVTKLETLSGVV